VLPRTPPAPRQLHRALQGWRRATRHHPRHAGVRPFGAAFTPAATGGTARFAELLVTERLLEQESDPAARRELLAGAIDDIYATVLRQAFFVRFEIDAHAAILDNRSTESLCDLYLENLERQFGSSVEIQPEFRYEWLGIPHIFAVPFYCYAYSFGQLLVLSLYRRYVQDPETFRAGYLRLLAYGGAARPQEVLQEAGIDMTDPAFWQGGFDVVGELIDRLEALG
jgi:oligoendopeptidase F